MMSITILIRQDTSSRWAIQINETDYQKDFDPQDFSAEAWNSIDEINDHHTDEYFYKEVSITETPKFGEDGTIDWENVPQSDEQEIVAPESDKDFVRDARNWLQRWNLIHASESEDVDKKILEAYPVSRDFLKYLEENEITWEVANERLEQFIGLRKTAADTEMFGAEVPPVEDTPIDYQEPYWEVEDSYVPEIPIQ